MPLYQVPILAFSILVALAGVTYWAFRGDSPPYRLIRYFWPFYAAAQIVLAGAVFESHLFFPLNLEFMESTGLQHVLRLSSGLPVYVEPTPEFVALAYNPLFYVICVPFLWIFGPSLAAVRMPAMLASVAAAIMIALLVKRLTRSNWWALMAAGVFSASYRVMDCYLDVGHRDSLLLLSILTGFWFLHRGSRLGPLPGILALAIGFWFKQSGLVFLVLGIFYALWHYPRLQAAAASLTGLALGPLLHSSAPGAWFGPQMHFFTVEVPLHWTALRWSEVSNLLRLLSWHFGVLFVAAGWLWFRQWRKPGGRLGILRMAIPGALASGAAVVVTPGSNNNVYIPMCTLLIVGGMTALSRLSRTGARGRQLSYALLALVFAPLVYKPQSVIASPQAPRLYAEFTGMLQSLDGPVYAPGLGPLYPGPGLQKVRLTPLVHVVPMADLVRGPGRDETKSALVRTLLRSVENPLAPIAYIVTHSTLEDEPTLAYLGSRYRLEKDFGKRYEPLSTLPARHGHLYPRFLYKLQPPQGAPTALAKRDSR